MDWADRTEGRGNAGKIAGSFFHPSGPSEFGYLIQRKILILQSKLARGAGRMPFHPVNPGLLEPTWSVMADPSEKNAADCDPAHTLWSLFHGRCQSGHVG